MVPKKILGFGVKTKASKQLSFKKIYWSISSHLSAFLGNEHTVRDRELKVNLGGKGGYNFS